MRYLTWTALPMIILFAFMNPRSKSSLPKESLSAPGDSVMDLGKKVFYATCFVCHKDSVTTLKVPGQTVLGSMTPRAILSALTTGKMKQQAKNLKDNEKKAVAQWLTNMKLKDNPMVADAYTSMGANPKLQSAYDVSGWGGNREGTGFRAAAAAGIDASNISSLKLKWAFAFPDATVIRSKPAIAGDWIIVGGQYGDVYAINGNSGKIGWSFTATAAIRGAITIVRDAATITAYFADYSTNVYAINVKTGKMIWNARAGFDPQSSTTGSVAVFGNKVFVPISSIEAGSAINGNYSCCISSGGLVALDAKTGKLLWRHRVVPIAKAQGMKKNGKPFYGPSGAPVWCSPTIDVKRNLVYIGTGENYSQPATNSSDAIQAINMTTGKLVWNFQGYNNDTWNLACPVFVNCPEKPGPDFDFGMAPILVKTKAGKEILVAGQKSGVVHALEPSNGKMIWQTRVGKGGSLGGVHWGMATDDSYVYVANADNVIGMNGKDTTMKPGPGLYALDLLTGKIAWSTPTPACDENKPCVIGNSAAPTVIPGLVFAGSLNGHLRAYSSVDGKIVWDFNTARDFETTNGIKGRGGSIDGPAPVIYNGMMLVNSGYGMFGQAPGNLLLAFEITKN